MTIDPRSLSHKPGEMAEISDYILREMKEHFHIIERMMEKKADISDIYDIMDSRISREELSLQLNQVSARIDLLQAGFVALLRKLDSEGNLANDYESSIGNILNGG